MKKILFITLMILLMTSCEEKGCRVIVTLTDGKVISSEYVNDYVSGVSNIKKCDGTNMQITTSNIKTVEEK